MKKETSNIGLIGIESIRIAGMKICDLPIAEQAAAVSQLPLSVDTERQNKINNIIAGYPTQRVQYLVSRINECRVNIERMKQLKARTSKDIDLYNASIHACKFRDDQVLAIDPDSPNKDKIRKELFLKYPPYNVVKMKEQIENFKVTIERADEVIQNENDSIAEMTGLKAICMKRDEKLRALNARIEAG